MRTELIVPPEYFHHDKLYDYILKSLKEFETTCNQEDGYIDQIFQIMNIENKCLLDTGECCLNVMVEASCFKPDIGKVIETNVEIIFPHGIFSSLYILRFLVPFNSLMEDYDYIQHENIYRHKRSSHVIQVGSKINIEITNLKYDKNHFSCIAKLV